MRAWRAGRVALVNAPGAGVADDKKVYSYVPDIIRFFLDEEPILATVPTLRCGDEARATTCSATSSAWWSSRPTSPGATASWSAPRPPATSWSGRPSQIEDEPGKWVAQPVIPLSTAPTLCDGEIAPRHVDLRPFTLLGPDGAYVTRGGLTRVARDAGSLVVNSSQGGGSKDTWVVGGRRVPPGNALPEPPDRHTARPPATDGPRADPGPPAG